ncbi:MAG TPA: dihydrolipoamide acetyltransferase family protein [Candidatus Binataceae bacterium]|nr:dihydrolipoamide acetyltransferase family protein [Candidatus Binataceae bacterium]
MSNEITMPKLSDTMEEGKIIRWLKHPGDAIHRGDAIAEVETDKADMVMESFDDGVIEEIKLNEGESAPVGAVIATIRASGNADSAKPAATASPAKEAPKPQKPDGKQKVTATPATTSAKPSATPSTISTPPPRPAAPPAATGSGGEDHKLRVSPLARRAAEEAGIDIGQIRGTGPEGRIIKRDIDNFLREQQLFKFRRIVAPREGAPGSREELSKMRKTIANRMAASKREIPHFYVTVEVDMEEAVRLKGSLEATEVFEENITYNDIIVKACALALGRYPRMNSSYVDEGLVIHPNINIGLAVAIEDGLILPVIRECERLQLVEIAQIAHRLVAKAGRGGFTSEELSGATFSISNMGMLGIEHFAAVIVPPQAAILSVSAIKERPVVRNGQLAVGKTMMVTVSCDHRIVDGVVAGRFLQELKRFLENPASLLV